MALWPANTHHFIIMAVVWYTFYYSECDESTPYGWWNDDVCMMTFNKNYVYCAMITTAYLTYDFFI